MMELLRTRLKKETEANPFVMSQRESGSLTSVQLFYFTNYVKGLNKHPFKQDNDSISSFYINRMCSVHFLDSWFLNKRLHETVTVQ